MLRDIEKAFWPQDTGKEKIAQGNKSHLAECHYQNWSEKYGIKCAFWSSTWQWCEHLHLTAGCNNLLQRYMDAMEHRLCELSSFKQYSSENKENLSPKILRSTLSANSWNCSSCTLEGSSSL